jgi:hypothetical protein
MRMEEKPGLTFLDGETRQSASSEGPQPRKTFKYSVLGIACGHGFISAHLLTGLGPFLLPMDKHSS